MSRIYSFADFDPSFLRKFYHENEGETAIVWSEEELAFLGLVSPLTIMHLNRSTKSDYPIDETALNEQAKVLANFLAKTVDNSIFKGILNPGMVRSKIRKLEQLFETVGETSPLDRDKVTEDNMLKMSYEVKKNVFTFAQRFNLRNDGFTEIERSSNFPFVDQLRSLLGDNLQHIILYGSSVSGKGKDYDLMLVVNKFNYDLYQSIEGRRSSIMSDKPLSVTMMPESKLGLFSTMDAYNHMLKGELKLIYGGTLVLPKVSEGECINQMYYQIGTTLTQIRGVLMNLNLHDTLSKSPEFLENYVKNELWIRRGLLQKEKGVLLSKSEVLEQEGFSLPDISAISTPDDVRTLLYDINFRIKERVKLHQYIMSS